jgi:RNA-binding protein YlmH
MEQRDVLLEHLEDLAERAVRTGFSVSRFLTPAEAQNADRRFARRRDVALSFEGGFEEAERVRAVFTRPDAAGYERGGLFSALKIEWREGDDLGHRDVLGALMALGVERDTLGDIVCEGCRAVLVCLPEMGGFIAENFTKAGRAGVVITPISLEELPVRRTEPVVKTGTVASLRLDAVLSIALGLSREKASALVKAERVSVNHQLCAKPDKELAEGAVLSVRGFGRVRLLEVGGTSKKGRIFIKVGV